MSLNQNVSLLFPANREDKAPKVVGVGVAFASHPSYVAKENQGSLALEVSNATIRAFVLFLCLKLNIHSSLGIGVSVS